MYKDAQKRIQDLRLHLLDMSKLSQRAVDYAIKGYKLGSPEFCRYVRRGDRELRELHRRITEICRQLSMKELALLEGPDLASVARFPVSALRISNALQATCTAAAEIAHHTMLLLEDVRRPGAAALEKVCYLINRLMCLCIVALFKRTVSTPRRFCSTMTCRDYSNRHRTTCATTQPGKPPYQPPSNWQLPTASNRSQDRRTKSQKRSSSGSKALGSSSLQAPGSVCSAFKIVSSKTSANSRVKSQTS